MTQIFTAAPIWVWPLLAILIIFGMRARRDRTAPAFLIYAMPLLAILALSSTNALPAGSWIWLVFAGVYLVGVWAGHRMQAGWLLGREGRLVRLKGESLTLVVIMVVFWANFVGGSLRAVAPQVYASARFHAVFTAILAICAGSFAGRAVRVWQAD